jgi:hypothetical protein
MATHTRKPIGKSKRYDVLKRDNFTCQYCGRSAPEAVLEIDHKNPVSNGGSNNQDNLVTSCYDCNRGKSAKVDEKALVRTEAIICSMTKRERARPEILNGSRRKRIARGSGVEVSDVNRLLKQYRDMKKMMKLLSKAPNLDRLGKGMFPGM